MRRRDFIRGIVDSAGAWPLAVRAQQREQLRRIGLLMSAASVADQQAGVTVFLEVLHQLGWIDGHNVRVEIRWARGDSCRGSQRRGRIDRTSGGHYHGDRPARAGSAAPSDTLGADRFQQCHRSSWRRGNRQLGSTGWQRYWLYYI